MLNLKKNNKYQIQNSNTMKIIKLLSFFLFISLISCRSDKDVISIIPKPEFITIKGGNLSVPKKFAVSVSDTSLVPVLNTFADQIKDLAIPHISSQKSFLEITLDDNTGTGEEGYVLSIKRNKISIKAHTAHGVFNGLQSLRQTMLWGNKTEESIKIPCCEIKDSPRFSWRGFMVDESRHFFGKEKIEQLLDIMALHKLNTFHWHLTDEPGWRIEIKKYPDLTRIGGKGNYHDRDASVAFYSQNEIIEIVKYASARFIRIIPEVDMPGHASAANRAYPEYCGGGSPKLPNFTFNPGKEGTYLYLTEILREICGIIPTPFLHVGGDEVHFGNEQWSTNPDVQKLMKRENLNDLKAVESYFNRRMADSVKSLHKTLVGWDEIVDTGLDPANSVVMWWRSDNTDQLVKSFEKKYKVVLCPVAPLYFDYVQDKSHKWGGKSEGAGCSIENVYNFPPDTLPGFKKYENQVLGIQANLWSEVIQNYDRFDFMVYPRICALSEAGWTTAPLKNYEDFAPRLRKMLNYFDQLKINYYNPFDPNKSPEPKGVKKAEVKTVSNKN